jgi:hypothetical protein
VEAFRLAEAMIFDALGVKTRKAAIATAGGAKYFSESKSGAITPDADAMRAFIEANPEAKITERAAAIVAERNAPKVAIKL